MLVSWNFKHIVNVYRGASQIVVFYFCTDEVVKIPVIARHEAILAQSG